ncbi:MAG: EAL domain-containing protein [Treponemataceae bacterium]|nr:EAL domain-containing protein [Treponemataceae bacterium]
MEFGLSSYFIIGELITCWVSFLICINIFLSFSLYDKRQRFFLYAAGSTLLASFFNIISVYLISHHSQYPISLNSFVTTLYFLVLLICPCVMSCYVFDIAYSDSKKRRLFASIAGIIQIIYMLFVLINIKTGWIFRYDETEGYIRGPLKNITYILSALYGLSIILTITIQRKFMSRRFFYVFMIYPFISLFFVGIQFLFPMVILTGVASFTSVLFAYLTVQSYMIEIDYKTGLLRESKLRKRISMQRKGGALLVIKVEKMNMIQSCLDAKEHNHFLLQLGAIILSYFPKDSYILSSNRFAAIGKNMAEVERKSRTLVTDLKSLSSLMNSIVPIPINCYTAAIEFKREENDLDPLMDVINNMLEKAKKSKDYTFQICDEAVFLDMERKRQIYRILKKELTLDSEKFQVWFQPIYSIQEKKFVYMEALSRLKNTELGDISPAEFVQVAENRGLVERLGFIAFQKVCKFIADNRDIVNTVSINFSVYQMLNPNIVQNVLETIERFGLSPSNIVMEITESIFIDNYDFVMNNMLALTKAGVKFYLDDFGTGYSNLTNVVSLPFSTIKMDRSLVLMMEESDKGKSLFDDLVSTFKGGGFKILVEGVETNSQREHVEKAGVDYIQGFLYSRPLPPEACVELLRKDRQKKA